ncbi:hypothetical protein H4219_006433, partial [Mycoemilia scoparia]
MSSILYDEDNPHNTAVNEMIDKYYLALDQVKLAMNKLSEADAELANISVANLDDLNNENILKQDKKCKTLKKVYQLTMDNLQRISTFLELTTGQTIDDYVNGRNEILSEKKEMNSPGIKKETIIKSSPVMAARKQMERVGLQLPSSPAKLFIEPNESFINQVNNGRPIPFKDLPSFGKRQGQIENIFELILKYEQIVSCYDYNVE